MQSNGQYTDKTSKMLKTDMHNKCPGRLAETEVLLHVSILGCVMLLRHISSPLPNYIPACFQIR